MSHVRRLLTLSVFALLITLGLSNASASAEELKTVFVIAMENHNWTQPANQFTGPIQQVFHNPNAPFINSLVDGTAVTTIDGHTVRISEQVSFATSYHNVLATPSGNNPHIHPSEPNYLWAEAGTNFGVANDNDPFAANGPTNQNATQHLVTFLTNAGRTWKSYQEDTDLTTVNGQLTNVVLPRDQWTVPLKSISGKFAAGVNQFNGSAQFNYAAKHNPQLFFTDSNGGNDSSTNNPLRLQYAPLQQLFDDLANNQVADYNFITPNQFNDMHTALTGGFQGLTGDAANIRQGDNFLAQIIPVIMASKAYKENGVIIIWFDESEGDAAGDNADDFNHTVGEIVISKKAHKNVNGVPFASAVNLSHSSDLRTMQEIFRLPEAFLGDAANGDDLSSLFDDGVIRQHDNRGKDGNDND